MQQVGVIDMATDGVSVSALPRLLSQESLDCHHESRGVTHSQLLDQKLWGDGTFCLGTQDNFPRNPSIRLHQAQPRVEQLHGQGRGPPGDEEHVKGIIPEKSPREKCAGRHGSKE